MEIALERTARIETDDGLRLTFRDTPEIEEELQRLVELENDRCSWAVWTLERREGDLVVAARSEGDGVARLHTMFG